MSQPDIINHNRPISSSSNRHPTINDDDNVVDQRISIMTSPTSVKRYATYDLNWNNLNYDLDQNNQDNDIITNSAQAARWSLPNSPNSNTNDDEPQSPFGGITVTTVKVVEILHSPTEKDDDFNGIKSQQRKSRPELLNLSSEELPVGIITSESSKDRKHNKQRINLSLPPSNSVSSLSLKNPKLLNQKKRSSIINSQKIKGNKNLKKSEMIIPKEIRGGSFYRKKLPPKNLEFGSTSNPIYSNDPTDMEADLPPIKHKTFPWLPGPPKPPQLLHASLVPLPRVNRVAINNHDSHIKNTLDNNENPKRKSKFNSNRLSRANSQRRRTSIIEPDPNRASLIFRRQIMEESLMMSFGGMMMNGVQQQPTSISKPPIRRKTKKGSNAKLEDREVRRERRRKEKLVKKLKESQNPPPRKQSHDKPIIPSPQKPKNNALPLLSSPPDRRLGNSNVNSSLEHSTDEPLPFPAHLARSTLFENNSNKERSKRKQQPYSPSKGQPIPSPISSISNNSRVITSNPEGKELTDDDVSQHEVINSEETSSINQLPSPNKSQKIGKNILGLFNKQTTKDSTSPSISQISSPTQLSLQSPPTTPITLSSTTPPQSPPLSPKTLKVPQQLLGKSIQNPEKKKKMEQFEALIANSETSSSKKPISGKIRAITTAITTVASTATSSASSSISMRKKSADGTPYNSPRHSSEGSFKSEGKESEKKNGLKRDSSNRGSLAESVRYRSDEMSELGPGDDGVIRVTLTPEVCR
ncbi:10890_t:CDS:2 [Rhizophagus irregularis]|nr:10890_t:CDS:2 [Rhizophagus irregularis]